MTLADTISLADRFPVPSHEAWIALVEKTLKGGSADVLKSFTRDGLTVEGLYREGPKSPVRPGLRDPLRPWDIRTNIRHPDPARANTDLLADLEGGAASVLIKIDPKGRSGVAVGSQEGLARVLDGRFKMPVAKSFPLAEVAEAHRYLESNQHIGKVVMRP